MSPCGFVRLTRRSCMSLGKDMRQRTGSGPSAGWNSPVAVRRLADLAMVVAVGRIIPPAPWPAASWSPSIVGIAGTSSCRRVGLPAMVSHKNRKSFMIAWMAGVKRIRLEWRANARCNSAWRWLNRPREAGSAIDMDRNSPRSLCQASTEARLRVAGYSARIS